ncbi:hypothetical protein KR018_006387 [Drosophila ironensis]|nr:hypothetical protein KR018_006387 [Drosophila ironensis]
MSTLPFLLSVADELDNINSQSYMDDFGLGFHPHRQYYRTPTIQLSLPASTDWTGTGSGRDWSSAGTGRHTRYRSYKFYDDSQNNLEEEPLPEEDQVVPLAEEQQQQQLQPLSQQDQARPENQSKSGDPKMTQIVPATATARKGLGMVNSNSHDVGVGGLGLNLKAGEEEDDENIDRTVRMYNLSKKCCKNYYRHALETGPGASGRAKCSNIRSESHKSSSSSEESLPKIPSPIEFLTCFLVKKSRTPKSSGLGSGQQLKKT